MQPATILTILGLAIFTVANPVSNPEVFGVESSPEARGLEERACPTPAEVQCSRGCPAVVKKACASCGSNGSCLVACQQARYSSCYSCCASKCTTC